VADRNGAQSPKISADVANAVLIHGKDPVDAAFLQRWRGRQLSSVN
jgi:hypothetical protein